jgi:hypothetical protein
MIRIFLIISPLWMSLVCTIATAQTASVIFPIDGAGKISAEVSITRPGSSTATLPTVNVNVLALPFSLRDDAPRPRSPEDVRIAILGKGDGYTLFALAIPTNRQSTIIRFDDAFKLSESSEGKAKISMDLSFPFLSQTDKELIATASALQLSQVSIELPREYDSTELSFRPLSAQWTTKRKLSVTGPVSASTSELWVVFPNPMQSQLQWAKVILAFLIGILTLSAHIPAFQERSVKWSLLVFVLAFGVLALISYYSYSLAKQLDFVEWAIAIVPHAVYGLLSSVYLIVARNFQATIAGAITADGAPRQFADVTLSQVKNGHPQKIESLDHLDKDGRYIFRPWLIKKPGRFVVTAVARGTAEVASEEFEIVRGKRIELDPIALPWRPSPPTAVEAKPQLGSTEPSAV